MKKYIYVAALFIAAILVSEKAFATSFMIESEKIPVSLQQVILDETGIFLEVNGELYRISGVVEEGGQFFAIPSPNAWYCTNCKHHVPYPMKTCPWCKSPRPSNG
ncbi:MAG: hypothetical protein KDK55_06770 [Chlamydiia bacterium]|nr:hypothetical protein [Chlamydiia bacterium]